MALTKIGKEGITGISNSANANAITIDSGENIALSGTLGVTGAITGTLATAAQTNITSVGTLTSFRSTGIDDNADALAITIDNSERVGIGTSPSHQLHVKASGNGKIRFEGNANTDLSDLLISHSTAGDSGLQFNSNQLNMFTYGAITFNAGTGNISGNYPANERMRITSSGNVAIGGTSASGLLHLHSSSTALMFIQSGNSSVAGLILGDTADAAVGGIVYDNNTDKLALRGSNNADRLTIDASGNVGIGTSTMTSYYAKDLVVSCADQGGITLVGGTSDSQYLMFADGTSGADRYRGYLQYSHNSDFMLLATNGAERVRIDSSGNVGVGAAPDPSVKLTVNGSVGPTNGTASLPTHTFYSDPNTGIYRPGADNLGFAVGGQSKAFLSTTQFNITPPIVAQGGIKLGGNSYALDDYEEGSWTPTANEGTVNYATQFGRYRKIGNMVIYYMDLTINSISGCNALRLTLPFTSAGGSVLYTGNFIAWDIDTAFNASGTFVRTFINPSANLLLFYRTVSNGENISGVIANPTGRCAGMFIQFT